jgi:hypothetical protein
MEWPIEDVVKDEEPRSEKAEGAIVIKGLNGRKN